ncbi:hypothetical protein ACRRTK_010311 [Alexandromys fortis]
MGGARRDDARRPWAGQCEASEGCEAGLGGAMRGEMGGAGVGVTVRRGRGRDDAWWPWVGRGEASVGGARRA